jgi:phospholipid transport system substrate-binding protein
MKRELINQRKYVVFIFCFCVAIFAANQAYCSSPTASSSLKSTLEEVLAVLQDEEFKQPENKMQRRNTLLCVLEHRFDFEEMARRSLAKAWRKRSASEKEHFVNVFGQLIQNSYIGKIESYSDEKIIFYKEKKKKNKSLVPTGILRSNNTEIEIAYKLIEKEERWRVYDVVVEGVSLVNNYRSQFKTFLGKDSFPNLIKQLETKVEKLRTENI